MERVQFESIWVICPDFADVLVRGQAFQGLEPSSVIVDIDEVGEVRFELLVPVVMIAFNGGFLDGSVHAFDLPVIRYEIRRRLAVRLFPERETAIW
jgi:hypothetical protein